ASVEQLRRPELRGVPLVVGGGRDADGHAVLRRGVVSAASYEARAFGVHSAMPLFTALRLCPQAVVVPVDFAAYRVASRSVFAIAREYTPLVEPLSLDEAFLDVTASERLFGDAAHIAALIRDRVLQETGLHASFGVATCKTVAKVASDLRKPRGFVVVAPGDEASFLAPLALRRLPGLGPSAERALQGLGIHTLGELAALPLEVVQRRLHTVMGRSLWERAQGIDSGEVAPTGRPKSVSREETFSRDVSDAAAAHDRIAVLAADVGASLRHDGLAGRTVTLKLRRSDFTTITRQHSLPEATAGDLAIRDAATALFDQAWSGEAIRLLGVGVSALVERSQMDLFTPEPEDTKIDHAIDSLRERFGAAAIRRGAAASLRDLDWRHADLRNDADDEDR
ncbi:MAG: DNA polymerase IV, partial [Candidatus Dormibacteraeota bacterium]|nr:DNA polymerase IV [Candidatus Dormibacteraeota bacterium]